MVNLRQQLKSLIQFPISLSLSGSYKVEGYIVGVKTDYIHFEDTNKIPIYIPIKSIKAIKRNSKTMQLQPSNLAMVKQPLFKDLLTSMKRNWLYLKTANTDFLEGVLSSVYTDNALFVHDENIMIIPIYEIVSVQEVMEVKEGITAKEEQVTEAGQNEETEEVVVESMEIGAVKDAIIEEKETKIEAQPIQQEVQLVVQNEQDVLPVKSVTLESDKNESNATEIEAVSSFEKEKEEQANEQVTEAGQNEETEEIVVESMEIGAVKDAIIEEKETKIEAQPIQQEVQLVVQNEQDVLPVKSITLESDKNESNATEIETVSSFEKEKEKEDDVNIPTFDNMEMRIPKKETKEIVEKHDSLIESVTMETEMLDSHTPKKELVSSFEEKKENDVKVRSRKCYKKVITKKEFKEKMAKGNSPTKPNVKEMEISDNHTPKKELSGSTEEKREDEVKSHSSKGYKKVGSPKNDGDIRQVHDANSRQAICQNNDPKTRLLYIVYSRVMDY